MPCLVRPAEPADRVPLQRMLELYQHDLSDIYDQDLDIHGEYGYPLDRYFAASTSTGPVSPARCQAYLAFVDDRPAGFAMVDGSVKVAAAGRWMEQFFVLKKYRRTGVGSTLARHALQAWPGYWEVGQMAGNLPAQAFWRGVIGPLTQGRYVEYAAPNARWSGVLQAFTIEATAAASAA